MQSQQFTVETITEALEKARGLVSVAAQYLGCTPQTVRNYMDRFPELHQIRMDMVGQLVDVAELSLFKNVKDGKESSVIYVLNQHGRDRGYGKRLIKPEESEPPPATPGTPDKKVTIKLDDDTEIEI